MSDFNLLRKNIESPESKKGMIELETLLSSIPAIAPESGGEGEIKKCAALKKWLLDAGFEESQFQRFDAPDSRVPSGIRPNMILTLPGKSDDYSIWVMAHMDVVPPGDLKTWKTDPWKVVYDEKSDSCRRRTLKIGGEKRERKSGNSLRRFGRETRRARFRRV